MHSAVACQAYAADRSFSIVTQQNHILTDIQKHQHRFNVQQPQLRNQFGGFVQQPSQSFAFPPQTIPNGRFIPPQPQPTQQLPNHQQPQLFRQVNLISPFRFHSNLIPEFIIQPSIQTPNQPQNLKQSQFQRSVQNQVGQVSFNQPPPQFLSSQPASIFTDVNGFGPVSS